VGTVGTGILAWRPPPVQPAFSRRLCGRAGIARTGTRPHGNSPNSPASPLRPHLRSARIGLQ